MQTDRQMLIIFRLLLMNPVNFYDTLPKILTEIINFPGGSKINQIHSAAVMESFIFRIVFTTGLQRNYITRTWYLNLLGCCGLLC